MVAFLPVVTGVTRIETLEKCCHKMASQVVSVNGQIKEYKSSPILKCFA